MEHKERAQWPRLAATVLVCVLIDLLGIWLGKHYQLPFWLNTVGVSLAACYTNIPLTLLTVTAGSVIAGQWMPHFLWFLPSNLMVALALCSAARAGYLKRLHSAMISGFGLGLLSVFLYLPMDLQLYGGMSGNIWGDALYDMLAFYSAPPMLCALAGEAVVSVVDKQLSIFLVWLILRLVERVGQLSRKGLRTGAAALVSVSLLGLLAPALTPPARAESETQSDYVHTIYDNTNGLPAAAMNMVAQTPDGSIWVGGYAGLCRGNGNGFSLVTDVRIAAVTALLTDRSGRLWIGTNDQGLAVWENEHFRFLNRTNGLPGNSVRAIYQSRRGHIYVATAKELCRISEDGSEVRPLRAGVTGVWSIAENSRGQIACVDYGGRLSLLEDDKLVAQWSAGEGEGRYTCVLGYGNDFLVGSADSSLLRLSMPKGEITRRAELPIGELRDVYRLKRDILGNVWVCAYNGLGYLTTDGGLVMLRYPGFDTAITDVLQDYQGNYWAASSRNGLMKLSRSPFCDMQAYLGLERQSVNAVLIHDQVLYCGTDRGLTAVDPEGERIDDPLVRAVGEERVRCILADRVDRIWVCTYGGGLFCRWPSGRVKHFTQEADGTAGDYFRCLLELPDGTIAAGGNEGLTFLRGGRVWKTITEADGLQVPQILCLAKGPGDTLYAGSDGAGIYVYQDGKMKAMLAEKNGLSSQIILRMIPYGKGYFVVTSNGLNYLVGDRGRVLEKFPYFNNFDVLLVGGKAWVTASCGVFQVDPEELLAQDDQPLHYQLFNHKSGLRGSLNANAWSCVDEQGRLYLCSTAGIQRMDTTESWNRYRPYKLAFRELLVDGEPLELENGAYRIGAEVDSIEARAAVYNYDSEELDLRFYLDGLEKEPAVIRQSELQPISYQNIPHGSYVLRLEVLDGEQEIMQQISCPVIKKARMWENTYYHIYLLVIGTWMVIFGTWVVMTLLHTARRKKELEVMSRRLKDQVRDQTSQIVTQAQRLTAIQQQTIEGMATLIESRDGSTGAHVRNTGVYVGMLARELLRRGMFPEEIDQDYVDMIARIAPLHDVGKIKVSDLVLNKPGKLTAEEYEIMKTHAAAGGEIIGQIMSPDMEPRMLRLARDLTTHHHERWDGRGYPDGLSGTDIPLCARIMAVADVFDALSSKRVYKQAMDIDTALEELLANGGSQFQKELVEVFVSLRPEIQAYLDKTREKE